MTRAECSYCRKEANRNELKRCSRCRYLLYCSKECQILSWNSTHKYNCQDRSVTHEDSDKASAREEKNLTSWLNTWSQSLCTAATAALDLANHDLDYLLNHCLYVELNKTGHKTTARRFTVEQIYVSHVDPLRKEYPELATMLADPPELIGKRARFLVAVVDQHGEVERVRARVWTDDNIEVLRGLDKEGSRAVAAGLIAGFAGYVALGDSESIPRMLEGRAEPRNPL